MKNIIRFISAVVLGFTAVGVRANGSLKVNIAPAAAVSGGAQWNVDAGGWLRSGATIKGLSAGPHTVAFKSISGWIAPASVSANVVNGSTTTLSATYTQAATLSVTLTPSSAQWRVDAGAWHDSGSNVGGLAPGNHTLEYTAVAGYVTPPPETITLAAGQNASLSRAYDQLAQVSVTLSPAQAQWRIDGGNWLSSGATAADLVPGSHVLEFSSVTQYQAPATETISLGSGGRLVLQRSYTLLSQILIGLSPSTGQWRANGGAWQSSGVSLWVMPGSYQIEYSTIPGYDSPPSETVTFQTPGSVFATTRYYTPQNGSLRVDLSLASAQWRVDGGAWLQTGTELTLPRGSHLIEYTQLAGYASPATETVTVVGGQLLAVTRNYIQLGQVSVTLSPTAAQWQLDGGAWLASGAKSQYVVPGSHTVTYGAVAGYITPAPETVTIVAGQVLEISRNYLQSPQLTVTLTPATAQWRVDGGSWLPSGTTVESLAEGSHTVEYAALTGYSTPPTESVILNNGSPVSLARTYTAQARVTVSLTPDSAQWRVDGGTWLASGVPSEYLAAGTHTIEYAAIANYAAPPTETVTLSAGQSLALSRAYTADPAKISVTTDPTSGQWRIYPDQTTPSGTWNASGATVVGLPPGAYDVQYSSLSGYHAPATNYIVLQPGDSVSLSAAYVSIPAQLTVTLSPSSAKFRVNGGAWNASGATVGGLPAGVATVEFSDVSGYTTPASTTVTLGRGDTQSLFVSYPALLAALTVTTDAPNAQWRVDGGAWQNSGTKLSNLANGDHVVEGSAVRGYTTPGPQTVTLVGGQSATVALHYTVPPAQLTVITNPASGQWQVYPANTAAGTAWNASATTVTNLAPGTYSLSYTPIAGWVAPNTTTVSLAAGDVKTISVSYTGTTAQINVALDQPTGQWRIDGGAWQPAGYAVSDLAAGAHQLEFSPVTGFVTPPPQTITLQPGDAINYSFLYVPAAPAQLQLNLTPSTAKWRVDGGAWIPSGVAVGGLAAGTHAIEFSDVVGFTKPYTTSLNVGTGPAHYNLTYDQQFAGIQVNLDPSIGGYRVNGWGWFGSGSGTSVVAGVPALFEYEPIAGYATPHSEYLEADTPQQWVTVTRTYQPNTGATVSIGLNNPQGTWRLSSDAAPGTWHTGSGTVAGLTAGTYTIEYGAVANWASPSAETITLIDQEDLVLQRTYTSFPGRISVTLSGVAGAQWLISPKSGPASQTWHDTGETVSGLAPGDYTINYSGVQDYVAPWSDTVTITSNESLSLTRQYHHVYDVTVGLSPYTAQWRIDGGDWMASGDGVWGIAVGDHTIEYGPAPGYVTPPAETITFTGQQIQLYHSYAALAQLTVYVSPSDTAQWRIDGGAWQASGSTVANLAFDVDHTIEYAPIDGYVTPPAETITLSTGQNQTLYRAYTASPASP